MESILCGSLASIGAVHVVAALAAAVAVAAAAAAALVAQTHGSSRIHVVLKYPVAAVDLIPAPALVRAHYSLSPAGIVVLVLVVVAVAAAAAAAAAAVAVLLILMLVMHNWDHASDGVGCLEANVADAIMVARERAAEETLGSSPHDWEASGRSSGWDRMVLSHIASVQFLKTEPRPNRGVKFLPD